MLFTVHLIALHSNALLGSQAFVAVTLQQTGVEVSLLLQ